VRSAGSRTAWNRPRWRTCAPAKAGETWYFTVKPKDGVAFGSLVTSTSVIVGSSAPVATALQLTPFAPSAQDALVANYLYSDPDGEPESGSELNWYRNGTLVPSLAGLKTVPARTARKGEAWSFSVRPKDGLSFGAMQTSAAVTLGNTVPSATNAALSPAQPRTEDVLQAVYTYNDSDGDAQSGSELRWYRNGLEQPSLFNQTVVPSSATTKREVWYYRVRPRDGSDYGPAEGADPLSRVLDYRWTQVSGEPVELHDADKATAWFLGTRAGARTFELVATAGASSDPVRTTVTVLDVAPWASVPARRVVAVGQEVLLDGSRSDDPNSDALSFRWTLEFGTERALLADADQPMARLTPQLDGRMSGGGSPAPRMRPRPPRRRPRCSGRPARARWCSV
jgi:hypothetical protein